MFLLTSNGLCNDSIRNALLKHQPQPTFAFIPTAANPDPDPKGWLIQNLADCNAMGPTDIIDIAAIPAEQALARIEKANVIVMGGGDTPYLLEQLQKSGLDKELPRLLESRAYVGISAGSIVTGPTLAGDSLCLHGETQQAPEGLSLVDIHFIPHLNSEHFPDNRDEKLKEATKDIAGTTYALDDDSALLIDTDIEVISEGMWKRYEAQS